MSIDERPVALPKLYGAPAYARPPVAVALSQRPFDPDQLPLEIYRTEGDRFAEHLPARSYVSAMGGNGNGNGPGPAMDGSNRGLRPRSFNLRAIAGRLLGGE